MTQAESGVLGNEPVEDVDDRLLLCVTQEQPLFVAELLSASFKGKLMYHTQATLGELYNLFCKSDAEFIQLENDAEHCSRSPFRTGS